MYPVRVPFICRQCNKTLRVNSSSGWTSHLKDNRRNASSITTSARKERPLRVGIIGSGPAGFYAAARVMQKIADARVDMYEQLPVPFGLVRYGVAPDHPEVKNCQDRFEEVASSERFNFIGNTTVGKDVRLATLSNYHDALLFSYGASDDRLLGIPGEHSHGVYSARAFVGWYNGLPEYRDLSPDLVSGEHAVVIGHGNVGLDIARLLLSDVDDLKKTDISAQALEMLSKSKVKKVTIAGRRGLMQASFTIKEVRELVRLQSAKLVNLNPELLPLSDYITKLPRLEQRRFRLAKLLTDPSPNKVNATKDCSLLSLVGPKEFITKQRTHDLANIRFAENQYVDPQTKFDSSAQVRSTDVEYTIEAELAFRSIGYKASSIPGLATDLGVDFDTRAGIIPNDKYGRALAPLDKGDLESERIVVPGCYCSGWVKNGPTGVIASTMDDAFATADSIIRDWEAGLPFLNGVPGDVSNYTMEGWSALSESVRGPEHPTSWKDWKVIDALEHAKGKEVGKPREKYTSIEDMLAVIDSSQVR